MAELLLLAVAASLVNQCAFLGPFGARFVVGPADRVPVSAAIGLAVVCALPTATAVACLYTSLADHARSAALLAPIVLVLVAATVVPAALAAGRQLWPRASATGSSAAPLALASTVILGLGHVHPDQCVSTLDALLQAATAAAAFALVQLLFALLAERIETADTPAPLRGAPILLVAAGLVLLALAGVGGIAAR